MLPLKQLEVNQNVHCYPFYEFYDITLTNIHYEQNRYEETEKWYLKALVFRNIRGYLVESRLVPERQKNVT